MLSLMDSGEHLEDKRALVKGGTISLSKHVILYPRFHLRYDVCDPPCASCPTLLDGFFFISKRAVFIRIVKMTEGPKTDSKTGGQQ